MIGLKARIQRDMVSALKAKESERLSAIRLLMAAMKQREVDERIELDDQAVQAIVEKLVKQRKDAAALYDSGGRPELATKERFEIAVLEAYLPTKLSESEIDDLVGATLLECKASSPAHMGKVMTILKEQLAGRADMAVVSAKVRSRLAT
ncbi:MAG: GatB/YqeY domain-containing protein [Zoogloeaceae bacterium]|nr:GatB/YqeY domain-containing protein [Zoogloeaceae bacterium]